MARIDWTVQGKLLLEPQLPEVKAQLTGGATTLPLAGVRVLLEAKEFGMDPTWDNWGEDVTDSAGQFSITKEKDGSGRMFRVRAMFKDDTLKIYPESTGLISGALGRAVVAGLMPGAAIVSLTDKQAEVTLESVLGWFSRLGYDVDWFTALEDQPKEDKRKPGPQGTVRLGEMIFRRGVGGDLGDEYGRRHAEIWYVVKRAMKFLAGLGSDIAFRSGRTLAIKHPHSTTLIGDAIEASYSDPFNNMTYLVRNTESDDFQFGTILHELMHLWVYQYTSGETGLAGQLIAKGTTHNGRLSKSWTGWHEAFAEMASNEISRREFNYTSSIYGYGNRTAENRPLSRPEMRRLGIRKREDIEFFEDGWLSAFGLLLCEDICRLDMQTAQKDSNGDRDPYARDLATPPASCTAPRLALEDLLRTVAGGGGTGRDDGLDRDDMTLTRFLNHVASTVGQFETRHVNDFARMLDPEETAQPWEILQPQKATGPDPKPPGKKPQTPKPQAQKRERVH